MIVTGAVVFLTIAGVLCGKKLFAGKDTSDHKGTKTSGYEYYYKDNVIRRTKTWKVRANREQRKHH